MRLVAHLGPIGLALLATACGGGSSGSGTIGDDGYTTSPGGTTGTPVVSNAVTVADNSFSPATVQVSPGTTVRWTWGQEAHEHNVRFSDGTGSETLGGNATYSRSFLAAGTYTYQCTLHAGMSGTVTVK